jgi:predicted PhzF superfamily epimerase YddE/YHI9
LVVDVAEAAQLLRVGQAELTGVPRLASVGSAKLLVEVSAPSVVSTLDPDLAGIADWSRKHGVSGMYVYCRLRDDVFQGRNFNHLERRFEDAATGVAAGALAVSLKRDITVLQGDTLGQPCTIQVRYAHEALQVGGRAVRVADSRSRVCSSG